MNIKNNKNCKITINDKPISTEKTADEMFEELEYKSSNFPTGGRIYYEYYNKKQDTIIQFWYDKTVSKYNEEEADYITMQELKAINKKCEELGWI